MEYVEGKSVASCSRRKGRLGADAGVEIGIQACAGLEYAHRQGIIHRDVKPGNLMVIGGPAGRQRRDSSAHEPPTGEMTIKLTDFGIARASAQTRLTQVGSVVGTAAYLAPSRRAARGDSAADVYALGVVLYQLLTGRLPWEGSSLAELAIRRENERPLPPTSYDPDVPETLSRAVLRSLEGDVAARYSSARELSRALRRVCAATSHRRRRTSCRPTCWRRCRPTSRGGWSPSPRPRSPRRRRRRRRRVDARPRPQRGRRPPPSGRSALSPAACCAMGSWS